jgi:hypothetical protein
VGQAQAEHRRLNYADTFSSFDPGVRLTERRPTRACNQGHGGPAPARRGCAIDRHPISRAGLSHPTSPWD